jgi:enoyl-CoA hydratase/carnithine racemase
MISLFEKSGYIKLDQTYKDLDLYQKNNVGLISMNKFKDDKKAHRISGNHLDYRMIEELEKALSFFEESKTIHSVILTSSHKVAFSRGAKIEEVLGASTQECRDFLSEAQNLLITVQSFSKPLIAAITGLTLGGGLELALACDYRISSTRENVVFGFPEITLGLIPAMGGTQNLTRVIGKEKALEMIINGVSDITPEKALELHLINKAVPPAELIEEAYQFAKGVNQKKTIDLEKYKVTISQEEIIHDIHHYLEDNKSEEPWNSGVAPIAQGLTRLLFSKMDEEEYLNGLLYEFEVFSYLQQTEDCEEGIQALIEERRPKFKGR